MSMDSRPLSTYRESEAGSIALVALVVMLVLSVLGLALLHFVRGGAESTHDYLRETQLEVAARGAIADNAYLVESGDSRIAALKNDRYKRLTSVDAASYDDGYGIKVTVTALRHDDSSGTPQIYLIACATESDREVSYERREIVKGVWRKNGDKYVYQGWTP